nr:MAG TPA: hypothetical protein [Caudoviricetes sp.]
MKFLKNLPYLQHRSFLCYHYSRSNDSTFLFGEGMQ